MPRKIFCAFALFMSAVFSSFSCFADDVTVTKEPYRYTASAKTDEYGNISIRGIFAFDSALYYTDRSGSFKNKYALVNADTGEILLNNLDFLNYYSEYSDLVYYGVDGKYGVYDIKNDRHICSLKSVFGLSYGGRFSEDGGFFTLTDGKLHYVKNDGRVGMAADIDYDKYEAEGQKLSTWDYLGNNNFKLVLHSDKNCYDKTVGIINSSGKVLLYADSVEVLYDDYYIIKRNQKYGVADKDGNEIVPCIYDKAESTKEYLTDYSKYNSVLTYNGGFVFSLSGKKYAAVNPGNKIVMEIEDNYTPYYLGTSGDLSVLCLAANSSDPGIYGATDKDGNVVIPFEYEYLGSFSEGLAAAKKDGKYGFIDKSGNVIIPFMYEGAGSFENGKAYVWDENYRGMEINRQNEVVSDVDESFVPKYRLTSKIDPDASSYYEGGIEITSSGKVVDISNLNVWPVVLGTRGEYVLAFSPDFTSMYRLNITDNSPHTESTVKLNGNSINVDISLIGFDASLTVVIGTYKGKTLVEHKTLKSTDSLKNIQFGSNCDTVKVIVWDSAENMSPLMYSESVPKSQWTDN